VNHTVLGNEVGNDDLGIVDEDGASTEGDGRFRPIDHLDHHVVGQHIAGDGVSRHMVGQHRRQRSRIGEEGIHDEGRQRTHGRVGRGKHRPRTIVSQRAVQFGEHNQVLQDGVGLAAGNDVEDTRGRVGTHAIVIRGRRVVVEGGVIRATGDLFLITHAVSVRIVQAVAVTIHVVVSVHILCVEAVVVRRYAGVSNVEAEVHVAIDTISILEDLDVEVALDLTAGGQLSNQDLLVRVTGRNAVVVSIQSEPASPDGVIDDNVSTRGPKARIEIGGPWVGRSFHSGHVGFAD